MDGIQNRWQLLGYIWRNHGGLLVKVSLLTGLLAVPMLFVKGIVSLAATVQAENALRLLYIPALLILSLGLCGGYGLLKNCVFQDGSLFVSEFWQSIRVNGADCLKLTAVFAVLHYLIGFSANFFALWRAEWQIAVAVVEAAAYMLWLGAYVFGLCQIQLYRNSVWRTVKNAWLLTFARLPRCVGILLVGYLPLQAMWYLPSAGAAVVLAVYLVIGLGHAALVSTLFCHSCFDEFVNRTQFPELYRKGLANNDKGAECDEKER